MVALLLRDDVTLPLKPNGCQEVIMDLQSGEKVFSWHCAFKGCTSCSSECSVSQNHEKGVWDHIWLTRDIEHRFALQDIAFEYRLSEAPLDVQMVCFTLYSNALVEKERDCIPLIGLSKDRRCLQHLGEVLEEDHVSVLICFICACKHIHIRVTIIMVRLCKRAPLQ